ncbi:MAG TPA: hypothetical protein VFO82_15140, partial [Steroidobacteraceae bacterium]|nr:hypothetical protein [Steroidobacteraceae bacterium]
IDARASELSALAGTPEGSHERAAGGWKRRYHGCTIYYSPETGAHEVHGAIRDKYEALNGPSSGLGLPLTDERDVGDGVGRFNEFEHGSIYWAPHTGAMLLRTAIRNAWRADGGPAGTGYPVRDQYRVKPPRPQDDPRISWVTFENGAYVETPDGVAPALVAVLTAENLRKAIRMQFDREIHEASSDVGLHASTEMTNVSAWQPGFWASEPRKVTIVLHGFRDNGVLPDSNFDIHLTLQFKLVWTQDTFFEPTMKTLIAAAAAPLRVAHAAGGDLVIQLLPELVVDGVAHGLYKAFFPDEWPDPAHPAVPRGAVWIADVPVIPGSTWVVDVVDVSIAKDGSLRIFVNPLPSSPVHIGIFRRNEIQRKLDALAAD